MVDTRWRDLASVLVHHAGRVAPGDRVFITMLEVESLDLATAVYSLTVQAGGLPYVEFGSALLDRQMILHGTDDQVAWSPEPTLHAMEWADVYIGIRGFRNPSEIATLEPRRVALQRKAAGRISALRNTKQRWVLVRLPNEALAQQAGVSLDEMEDFFFRATIRDWAAEAKWSQGLAGRFERASTVRLVGADTDLTFSTHGRTYEVGDGRHNMPDGEIYTSPVESSANGTISFDFPAIYAGRAVEGIRLEFRDGVVTGATARANEALLRELLGMDGGSNRLGEFGVGTNFGIDRFSREILYDEKIGGTIHLALGRSYPECGGQNNSSLHWDIVKDMRTNGSIFLDDELAFENGKFNP